MSLEDLRFDGRITAYSSEGVKFVPDSGVDDMLCHIKKLKIQYAELRLNDGRRITSGQRKKIFAIIGDICAWTGDIPEYMRQVLTWYFRSEADVDDFSLSDIDMTTATEFISFLINFCFTHDIPTRDTLLNNCDDIHRYLYMCLYHRKCAVCNDHADVHHIDRVGMGRDRNKINHLGLKAVALCRKHHTEIHIGEQEFLNKYHIFGIALNKELCERLKLNYK
ncbi:MAG: putative HNHc nuclease [Clostridiales bacterium]|nr:putative HNHc nuclease [Clostridiales bacterium]